METTKEPLSRWTMVTMDHKQCAKQCAKREVCLEEQFYAYRDEEYVQLIQLLNPRRAVICLLVVVYLFRRYFHSKLDLDRNI